MNPKRGWDWPSLKNPMNAAPDSFLSENIKQALWVDFWDFLF